MLLPEHEFLKPASLTESLEALSGAEGEVKLLGGGTDVVFNMRGKLFTPDLLLSLKDLTEIQQVEALADGSLRLGAGCRLTDLEHHGDLQRYPALVQALRAVASRHVRNMATLGGNLCLDTRCWYTNQTAEWRAAKGPCLKTGVSICHAIKSSPVCVALNNSDTAPMLIALDAVVTLTSTRGQRQVPLEDFYTEDGLAHTVRDHDEILTAVTVPPTRDRLVYFKETARKGNDFAYATIAGRAAGREKDLSRVKLVMGSLTTRPMVLDEPAAAVLDLGLNPTGIQAAAEATREAMGVLTNLYTPAAYKGRLARMLVRRALTALAESP